MTGAETLKAVHSIGDKVDDKMHGVQDALQAAQDKIEGMLQGLDGKLQGVTDAVLRGVGDKAQGVDDRVKGIGVKATNSAQAIQVACPLLLFFIWLGNEKVRQQRENDVDTVTVEGPEGVCDKGVDVDEVWSAANNIKSSAIPIGGAQVFPNQSSTPS